MARTLAAARWAARDPHRDHPGRRRARIRNRARPSARAPGRARSGQRRVGPPAGGSRRALLMLLALDTTTSVAGLALHDGERVRAEQTWWAGRHHTEQIL